METHPYILCALFDGWCSPPRSLSSSLSRFSRARLFDPNLIRLIDEYLAPLQYTRWCRIEKDKYQVLCVDGEFAYTTDDDHIVSHIEVWHVQGPIAISVAKWLLPAGSCGMIRLFRWVNDQLILFFHRGPLENQAWSMSRQGQFISKMDLRPLTVQPYGYLSALAVEPNRGYISWANQNVVVIYDASLEQVAEIDTSPTFFGIVLRLAIHPEKDQIFVLQRSQQCKTVTCFNFQGVLLHQWSCDYFDFSIFCIEYDMMALLHAAGVSYRRQDNGEELLCVHFSTSTYTHHFDNTYRGVIRDMDGYMYIIDSVPRKQRKRVLV